MNGMLALTQLNITAHSAVQWSLIICNDSVSKVYQLLTGNNVIMQIKVCFEGEADFGLTCIQGEAAHEVDYADVQNTLNSNVHVLRGRQSQIPAPPQQHSVSITHIKFCNVIEAYASKQGQGWQACRQLASHQKYRYLNLGKVTSIGSAVCWQPARLNHSKPLAC